MVNKLKIVDLFCGCGGFGLGAKQAGFDVVVAVDIDKTLQSAYKRNFPNTRVLTGDLSVMDADAWKIALAKDEIDGVIGGPPCQPFSVGGNQKGIEDSRDGFPLFIDAVKKLKPKVFMFENVRGLLYSNRGYFELVVTELQKLGYIIDYKLLNAVNFGVPQNRERLFVIDGKNRFRA